VDDKDQISWMEMTAATKWVMSGTSYLLMSETLSHSWWRPQLRGQNVGKNTVVFLAVLYYTNIDWQCWSRLTINVLLCHEINATNLCRHPWRSNIAYGFICVILRSDQKIDANAWCHVVYTMFPGNIDHVMPCSLGTWRCTDETGPHNIIYFLHITWR